MLTSEITSLQLDWAVAKCEGAGSALVETYSRGAVLLLGDATDHCDAGDHFHPSTNWAQGGPIIEREKIELEYGGPEWWACIKADEDFSGTTPLIAAMRCYVASKLGDEVDVPPELQDNVNVS